MPLYDYQCSCGYLEHDRFEIINSRQIICPDCSEDLTPDFFASPPAEHNFKVGYYEQLTGNQDTLFTSKKQLKAEADRRGKYSDYVS